MGLQQLSASIPLAQAEDITVEAMQEHVARAVGLPARRQFLVVAEERARSASLGHLAKRMQVLCPGAAAGSWQWSDVAGERLVVDQAGAGGARGLLLDTVRVVVGHQWKR